jgi:RsiW-degrading membrane proteinase PrsW (M82 family)
VLAVEPFPAIFVSIFGFALIDCNYFLAQKLKVESDFCVVICLFLGIWSLSLVMAVVVFVKAGLPPAREDTNDFYFSLLRGCAVIVNLFLFHRWVGAKKMITRLF